MLSPLRLPELRSFPRSSDRGLIEAVEQRRTKEMGVWFVAANGAVTSVPSGTVQFSVDGSNEGEPVTVDAKGRAAWETSRLRVGKHRVAASYVPSVESTFLPTSIEKIHVVRRCHCEPNTDTSKFSGRSTTE